MEAGRPKLLDRVRDAIRARHYSRRTEVAYATWIRRYIGFRHLSRDEVATLLSHLEGTVWIVGMLLYGAGLRLEECLELRVKDIDFDRCQIVVRRGKGQKDRTTMVYTHVLDRGALAVKSPADRLVAR